MGASMVEMPPWGFCWVGRMAFLTMFTFSTTTRDFSGTERSTLPVLPRSLPEITFTVSPLRIVILF